MPCHISLSSVLDKRTTNRLLRLVALDPIWTGKQFSSFSPRRRADEANHSSTTADGEAGPTKPPKEELKRKRHLDRLDKLIDPNDLTATLEAHRELNRASLIRVIPSYGQDEHFLRPSFLKDYGQVNKPAYETKSERQEKNAGDHTRADVMLSNMFDKPNLSISDRTTSTVPSPPRHPQQLENPHRLFGIDTKAGHPMEESRRDFLRKHETPLQELSATRTRASYLDSIRRVRWILMGKSHTSRDPAGRVPDVPDDILEYEARFVQPRHILQLSPMPEPWAGTFAASARTPYERLDQEIDLFAEWIEPTPAEQAARAKILKTINDLIQTNTPELQTQKYGSQTTGLALPMSDMDLRMFRNDEDAQPNGDVKRENMQTSTNRLHRALTKSPHFKILVRHQGRFPLIGATHAATGLIIQLVAASEAIGATREKTMHYLSEYPNLKSLYLVIKTMFDMRKLSDVWYGGLGSYTIFMMIVASLKHTRTPASAPLSHQLLTFLTFWSDLDMYTHGVSIEPPTLFAKQDPSAPSSPNKKKQKKKKKKQAKADADADADADTSPPRGHYLHGQQLLSKTWHYQRYLLCLQDPANPYNDLGRKSFAIKDIQATIKTVRADLESMMAAAKAKDSKDGVIRQQQQQQQQQQRMVGVPFLRAVVGRCDRLYDVDRARLDLFGEGYIEEPTLPEGAEEEEEEEAEEARGASPTVFRTVDSYMR